MQEECAINWAEDAFNSLSNSYQFFDPSSPIVFSPNRELTPSLLIDGSSDNSLSPSSPITPSDSTKMNIIEGSHEPYVANIMETSTQPLRKSSRKVSQNKNQPAAPEKYQTSKRHRRTADTQKNSMVKRKRGRPTSYRADEDENLNESTYLVPSTVSRETYLEKNRRAAQRCRERKKAEQEDLCKKAQDGAFDNVRLKHMVSSLQEEAFVLKSELLRHANCGYGPVEEYLERSAKLLAKAGLEERRKSTAEPDHCPPSIQSFSPRNSLPDFSAGTQEDATQVSRPASQCSFHTPQSMVSFSERSIENDTTPSSISSSARSPLMNKGTRDISCSDFNLVSLDHHDRSQIPTNISGPEGSSSSFVDPSQWVTV